MDTAELYRAVLEQTCKAIGQGCFNTRTSALAIFPGGGNRNASDPRLTEVDWAQFTQKVWVAGTRGDPRYRIEEIRNLLAIRQQVPSLLAVQGWAEHTLNQMRWVTNCICADACVDKLILSTSKYHIPRCVLTFIKVWKNEGDSRMLKIAILPTSDPRHSPDMLTVSTSHTMEEEQRRIKAYQQKGDVGTAEDFFAFIR